MCTEYKPVFKTEQRQWSRPRGSANMRKFITQNAQRLWLLSVISQRRLWTKNLPLCLLIIHPATIGRNEIITRRQENSLRLNWSLQSYKWSTICTIWHVLHIQFQHTNQGSMGHSLKLAKKRVNTDLRRHFFSDRVINNWNSLDARTVTSRT